MSAQTLLTGQTLTFTAQPGLTSPDGAAAYDSAGGVLIEGGAAVATAPAQAV